ncbi:MAG: glycosyltransferase family 2 protein [Myxococcota bacterium]
MQLTDFLTIVIPTKNERRNIDLCLDSIPPGLEVHVVDSSSSDGTAEIAGARGAVVHNFSWNGRYPKKRNWFLEQRGVRTKWVLFLDADERLTPAFVQELEGLLPQTQHVGFWVRYSDHFMGKPLNWGIPMKKLSLFRVDAGRYERIDDNSQTGLDMEIHEHPVLRGSVGRIGQKIQHVDENPLEKWIARHNAYSTWEANRVVTERVSGNTVRQRIKYLSLASPLFPAVYFSTQFVIYGGFLDGVTGLRFASAKALYFATVRQKIIEMRDKHERESLR